MERKIDTDINTWRQNLAYLKSRFRKEKVLSRIENEKRLLGNKLSTIRAADPKTSLKRGFSLLYKEDGVLIKSISQVKRGGILLTDLSDGQVSSTVNSIKEK